MSPSSLYASPDLADHLIHFTGELAGASMSTPEIERHDDESRLLGILLDDEIRGLTTFGATARRLFDREHKGGGRGLYQGQPNDSKIETSDLL